MTIDEAIKEFTDWAKDNRNEQSFWAAERDENDETNPFSYADCEGLARDAETRAEYNEQLAEWLRELKDLKAFITSIYQILGEHFEYPCSNEVAAELMKERSTCFDCGGKIDNEECWRRFFTTMIGEKCNDD